MGEQGLPPRKTDPTIDDVHLANEEALSAVPAIVNGKTVKVSPKVAWPTIAGIAVGVILIATGNEDTGLAVLLAALGYGGIGAAAGPGTIEQR